MQHCSPVKRFLTVIIMANMLVYTITGVVVAQENQEIQESAKRPTELKLKKPFLRQLKFLYGEGKPRNVYGYWGLTHTSEFKDVLSRYPPSLREARKVFPYNAVVLGGSITILALSLKNFVETINQAVKVSGGEMVGSGAWTWADLVMLAVTTGVVISSSLIGAKHTRKAVRLFNEHQAKAAGFPVPLYVRDVDGRGGTLFGLSFANVSTYPARWTVTKRGLKFGGYLVKRFSSQVALQPEFLISTKGYNEQGLLTTLTYLEFPVLLRVQPIEKRIKPHFLVGPTFGLRLGTRTNLPDDLPWGVRGGEDRYRTLDWGLAFGIEARVGDSPWVGGIRHTRGLSSIIDSQSRKMKNRETSIIIRLTL